MRIFVHPALKTPVAKPVQDWLSGAGSVGPLMQAARQKRPGGGGERLQQGPDVVHAVIQDRPLDFGGQQFAVLR